MDAKHTLPLIFLILLLYASPSMARADACPTAPLSLISVGDTAVVADGVDGLNMRTLPAISTGIEVKLYHGNQVTILAGPSCNGGYNWWRVELADGRRGWVAEGDWEQYYLVPVGMTFAKLRPLEAICIAVAFRWLFAYLGWSHVAF
jgi:SH3 domain-containing protein